MSEILIINHESYLCYIWQTFCIIICIVSSFYYAYCAAFYQNIDENLKFHIRYMFEIVFLIDMISQFFTSYPCSNKTAKCNIRDISLIIDHYIRGGFVSDLIPLLPFQYLSIPNDKADLFLLIKIFRISKGLDMMNVTKFMISTKKK